MLEEMSRGEYLSKAIETPKIWRSEYEGKPIIEFEAWVSTEAIDRDGEIIRASGWRKPSLGRCKLLLFHDYHELAIGKPYWTKPKEEGGKKGLYSKGRFGPQLHGLAVGELYMQGDMDSFSVGFNWFKRTFDSEADGIKNPFYEYLDQEIYEYSAVNIPSNYEATIAMLNSSADLKDMMAIIKGISKQPDIIPQKRDSYIIKENLEMKKAIEQFSETNKRMLDLIAKLDQANITDASEYDDDTIEIELDDQDDIEIELDDQDSDTIEVDLETLVEI